MQVVLQKPCETGQSTALKQLTKETRFSLSGTGIREARSIPTKLHSYLDLNPGRHLMEVVFSRGSVSRERKEKMEIYSIGDNTIPFWKSEF
jgi:hypothetical protein